MQVLQDHMFDDFYHSFRAYNGLRRVLPQGEKPPASNSESLGTRSLSKMAAAVIIVTDLDDRAITHTWKPVIQRGTRHS